MKRLLLKLAGIAVFLIPPSDWTRAQDASWGCQVLLCAASREPSWQGIGYCVPPMTRLIREMKKPRFSWPICREANVDKSGYEEYGDCPVGTRVNPNGNHGTNPTTVDRCIQTVDRCEDRAEFQSHYGDEIVNERTGVRLRYLDSGNDDWRNRNSCLVEISIPRPRRTDPYYFDIADGEGGKRRFWFNLRH